MFGDSLKFFDLPPTKWWSFKSFAKLNENHILMAIFSKLRNYQTFLFIELHNLGKGQLADKIFKLWKSSVYFWNSGFLSKISWKNFQVSKYILKVIIKFYRFANICDLKFLDNETMALWIFFEICREERFAS